MPDQHGNAVALQLHQARGEALCASCEQYLKTLKREGMRTAARRTEEKYDVLLSYPLSTAWRLEDAAERAGVPLPELIMGASLTLLDPPRGQARRLAPIVEAQIRAMWLNDKSDSEISRELGITRKAVSDRREKWGLPPNRAPGQANPKGSNGRPGNGRKRHGEGH